MKQEFESGGRGRGRYIASTGRYQEVKGKVTDQTSNIKRVKTQRSSPEMESQIRRCIMYICMWRKIITKVFNQHSILIFHPHIKKYKSVKVIKMTLHKRLTQKR